MFQPCQSLFVAPCSHTWHYKCVRRIINGPHWPHFVCPNCRAVADLDADVDEPTEGEWEEFDTADLENSAVGPLLSGQEEETPPIEPAPDTSPPQSSNQTPLISAEVVLNNTHADYSADELMANLDINDRGRSDESENLGMRLSAPIDIAGPRRSVSRRRDDDESEERRTPSPQLQSADILSGVDGPMTPRNDAGPFIFDGSGGNRAIPRSATPNMGAVVESPISAL